MQSGGRKRCAGSSARRAGHAGTLSVTAEGNGTVHARPHRYFRRRRQNGACRRKSVAQTFGSKLSGIFRQILFPQIGRAGHHVIAHGVHHHLAGNVGGQAQSTVPCLLGIGQKDDVGGADDGGMLGAGDADGRGAPSRAARISSTMSLEAPDWEMPTTASPGPVKDTATACRWVSE